MRRNVLAVAVLLLGAACSGSEDRAEPPIQQTTIDQGEVDAGNYDVAYQVCEAVASGQVTDDFATDPLTEPEAYAHEYAAGYEEWARQANYDGCLDGLLGRPQNPPG